MAVLGVVGVLVASAAPSFREVADARRIGAASSQIVSAVRLARAESIKRSGLVAVRPLDGTRWESGLIVHVESDRDASNARDAADPVIRRFEMPPGTLPLAGAPAVLAFDPQGRNVEPALDGQPRDSTIALRAGGRTGSVSVGRSGSTVTTTATQPGP